MTILKMGIHRMTGRRMVEVYDDYGRFVCSIYPCEDGSNSIHVVSAHFDGEPTRDHEDQIPLPGYHIKFNRPY